MVKGGQNPLILCQFCLSIIKIEEVRAEIIKNNDIFRIMEYHGKRVSKIKEYLRYCSHTFPATVIVPMEKAYSM